MFEPLPPTNGHGRSAHTTAPPAGAGRPLSLPCCRRRLGERLLEKGMINPQQLAHALEQQAKGSNDPLGQILVGLGYVPVREMGALLQEVSGIPHVDLSTYTIDPETLRLLPESLIRERLIFPLRANERQIWLAMADPLDLYTLDDVRLRTGRRVVPMLALPAELLPVIRQAFGGQERALETLQALEEEEEDEEDLAEQILRDQAGNGSIIRKVNGILEEAFLHFASDIHLEPQEKGLRVRYRVDGVLYEQMMLKRSEQAAILSRLKVMGHMNIAERRRPQDGHINYRFEGRKYDLRISVMPTIYGEKAVLRVLDKESMAVPLEDIGFFADELKVWRRLITRPYGMVLVTGPTGSGKSTTLYASLDKINDVGKNITTIEDPVEYQLNGINQTQVNVRAGVTFAAGLRTLVRQDPDIILVGEIRDQETAEIAINAALTGHLVFATLHTNDAPGAVVRLGNMGIEPFLIASSVLGVVGQRLVRKICPACQEWYQPEASALEDLGIGTQAGEAPIQLARGPGCRECGGKGYRGRTAVFEVMVMNDRVRSLVVSHASSVAIKQQAVEDGMRPMHQSAVKKVLAGVTTPDEVARVLLHDEM